MSVGLRTARMIVSGVSTTTRKEGVELATAEYTIGDGILHVQTKCANVHAARASSGADRIR